MIPQALRAWLGGLLPLLLIGAAVLAVNHLLATARDEGYQRGSAEGRAALEALRASHATEQAERAELAASDAKAAAQQLQQEQAHAGQLAADLAELQRTHRQTTDRLSGEIARVNDLYRKALDAAPEPLPTCVFTRGWVRVYDQATGAAPLSAAEAAAGAAAPGAEARALEQLDSGISQGAVLAHHVRYAEQCRNLAGQLDALINAVETP